MNLRNICIIAHVDHGKTTLVDFLLRQSGTFQAHEAVQERVMDSMDLERERGITILAKNTSIPIGDTKINIVDTPGHADFGGEVERIMGMVDGALLLVDAAEGPLPQTRFVLEKALACGHRVILVINKVDRPECRTNRQIQEVVNQTFDLFVELGATEEQAEFPIIYACGRDGWCTSELDEVPALLKGEKRASLKPLFDLILNYISPPKISDEKDFQLRVSNLAYSDYVGRLAIGRVVSGSIRPGDKLIRHGIKADGTPYKESFAVTTLYTFEGLDRVEAKEVPAGDICLIAGTEGVDIGDTLTTSDTLEPMSRISVEKPTLGMIFSVNTAPFSGQEGEAIQSRKLRERLLREVHQNVALRFEEMATPDQFRLLGRGEFQFAILCEQMRREGFEFMIGRPTVLIKKGDNGETLEPIETAVLDLPDACAGEVAQMFQVRRGILTKHEVRGKGRIRFEFEIPTRGLLGMRSRYLTSTRGAGLMSSELKGYEPYKGDIPHRTNGALVADREGMTITYGLMGLEDRGVLFLNPGIQVYEGMVVGEHAKENDLNVNVCREKKLTNVRSSTKETFTKLAGVRTMSLENAIEWIDEDEWIEITPKSIRMRKKVLPKNLRSLRRSDRVGLDDEDAA